MNRIKQIYQYKIKTALKLMRSGNIGLFFGILIEKLTGTNPYVSFLNRYSGDTIATRKIRGHQMDLDLADRGLSRHLFIKGTHEQHASNAFLTELRNVIPKHEEGCTVLDVGANIGYYVLLEAEVVANGGIIYGFEPNADAIPLLRKNITENGYSNIVTVVESAVGNRTGTAVFSQSTHSNWSRVSSSEAEIDYSSDDEIVDTHPVQIQSIDDFLTEREIKPSTVAAVRMDLEGYETTVLQGMTSVINSAHPMVLFVEFHPESVDKAILRSAINTLNEGNFEIQYVGRDGTQLAIDSIEECLTVGGSHIRLVVSR